EFVPTVPAPPPPKTKRAAAIAWPAFGYDPARLHVGWGLRVRPPFKPVWKAGSRPLVEFSPSIGFGRLYVENGAGVVLALSTRTGKRAWSFRSKHCAAASPAVGD